MNRSGACSGSRRDFGISVCANLEDRVEDVEERGSTLRIEVRAALFSHDESARSSSHAPCKGGTRERIEHVRHRYDAAEQRIASPPRPLG